MRRRLQQLRPGGTLIKEDTVDPTKRDEKKPYQKPQVVHVPLRAEEAVLGFCKNSNNSGPLRAGCLGVSPCRSGGS